MWPGSLIVSIIALTVVIERIFWWGGRWFRRRDPKGSRRVFTAIEVGDVAEASRLSRDTRDPVLRMMWNGLNHQRMPRFQVCVAGGRRVSKSSAPKPFPRGHGHTLVTLAPLLGLLGTITGLIRSFSFTR